jgi:hypothetical protein
MYYLYTSGSRSQILKKEHRLRLSEKKMLKKIFRLMRLEITRGDIIYAVHQILFGRRMRPAGHKAHMGEARLCTMF